MKKLLLICAVFLMQCGPKKFAHPVAVVARAEVRQAGQSAAQGIVQAGDTVDLIMPYLHSEAGALVWMRNGKKGFVPVSALALPDSLR